MSTVNIIENNTTVEIPASNIVELLESNFSVTIAANNSVTLQEVTNVIQVNNQTVVQIKEELVNIVEVGIQGPPGAGVSDHGLLTGLGDDDHTQYHNDARALTWLGTRSTDDLPVGSSNLYYTTALFNVDFASKVLNDLSDVTITSIAAGEILKYDGNEFINNTFAEAGVSAVGHTHNASDVTSGTLADARISSSSVTQHEANIDHDALTNFDANEHIDWQNATQDFDTTGTGNITDVFRVRGTASKSGSIELHEKTGGGGHKVTLTVPLALAGDYNWTFPATDGDSNQIVYTDGNGNLNWAGLEANDFDFASDTFRLADWTKEWEERVFVDRATNGTTDMFRLTYNTTITDVITKAGAGSYDLTVVIDGTNLGGSSNAVSVNEDAQTHSTNNVGVGGEYVSFNTANNINCTDIVITLKGTRDSF